MNRWNRAGISLFYGDQNTPYNQILAQAPLMALGKYGLPLPYVIAGKMRGPLFTSSGMGGTYYVLADAFFNCLGTNVMPFAIGGGACANWPATITINPA